MSACAIADTKRELDAHLIAPAGTWRRAWVPFLDDDAANSVCLDTSQGSAPVRTYWLGGTKQAVLASSLAAWLDEFVTAVERGEYLEDPERGLFLRCQVA